LTGVSDYLPPQKRDVKQFKDYTAFGAAEGVRLKRQEVFVIGKQKCSENGKYNAVKMGTGIQ
jgi:hypothetical protein